MFQQSLNENLPETDKIEIIKTAGEKQRYLKESEDGESEPDPDLSYIASREEVSNAIETAFKKNNNLSTKLLKYIQHKIFLLTGKKVINGVDPEDILFESIKRILQGKRKWKKNIVPNVVHFILMVASSLIKHQLEKIPNEANPLYNDLEDGSSTIKKKKLKPKFISLNEYDENEKSKDKTIIDEKVASEFDQSNFDFEKDGFEEMVSKIENELEADNDLNAYYVFQERVNGIKSNIKIADNLGITVKDVENALKRIKRIIKVN